MVWSLYDLSNESSDRRIGPDACLFPHVAPRMGYLHHDPGSKESLALINGWIDNCGHSHQRCMMPQQVRIPKRLLQCLPNGFVRLVETHSLPQPCGYIALSYCWGDDKEAVPKTNEATLDRHQRGIPVKDLPRLFQEVFALACGVDIAYLWIDSLCIIQDSDKDKDEELMKMSDIFRGAFVVFVAASARSPSESLLRVKPQSDQSHIWSAPSVIRYQEMDIEVRFRKRALRAHFLPDTTLDTPTGGRAWCYQEKLLATRCLVFCDDEVVWECRSGCQCECGGKRKHLAFNEKNVKQALPMRQYAQKLLPLAKHEPLQLDGTLKYFADAEAAYSFWQDAVRDYSRGALSFKTDRLPAISAAASIVAEATQDRYLAGLWRKDLLAGLSWVASWEADMKGLKNAPRPHQDYIAPTWSWASLPRGVFYPRGFHSCRSRDTRDARLGASVDIAWTNLEGQNKYGRVSDAAIVLSGFHCDAELTIPEHGRDCESDGQLDFGDDDVQTVSLGRNPMQVLDFMLEPDTGNPRYLRRVTDWRTHTRPACSGTVRLLWLHQDVTLILTPSRRKEGAYERLGIYDQGARRVGGERSLKFVVKMPEKTRRSSIELV